LRLCKEQDLLPSYFLIYRPPPSLPPTFFFIIIKKKEEGDKMIKWKKKLKTKTAPFIFPNYVGKNIGQRSWPLGSFWVPGATPPTVPKTVS